MSSLPDEATGSAASMWGARVQRALDRIGSYAIIYVAVAVFAVLYVFSVKGAETALGAHFQNRVAEALHVTDFRESVATQIQRSIRASVRDSGWVRYGGVRANVLAIGRDGRTLIYAAGATTPPPGAGDLMANMREAERLLPASANVTVILPHNTVLSNAILLVYAAALVQGLFLYNRWLGRQEREAMELAMADRDAASTRAAQIEHELDEVRVRLLEVEPTEREQAEEIASLQHERERLQAQLASLASREEELRGKAAQAVELDQERRALEDLLEEAAADITAKDDAIVGLEQRLTKADKRGKTAGGARARERDAIARRLTTLYKNLEIDERAIDDIAALGDESLRLKAEENLKRLDSEADNVSVRRKVGGLPGHLSIFELSFAGKGRIYYTKGGQRRFRVLLVGGKASQKPDLEYLSRITV